MVKFCRFSLLVIIFFFYSCKGEQKLPEGVIKPEKMQLVLLDIMNVDEYMNQSANVDTTRRFDRRYDFYQKVFLVHKVTKEQFKTSFTYYQNRPDLLKIILDSMHSIETKKADVRNSDTLKKLPVDTSIKK